MCALSLPRLPARSVKLLKRGLPLTINKVGQGESGREREEMLEQDDTLGGDTNLLLVQDSTNQTNLRGRDRTTLGR